jgi:hypothetical protein
MATWAFVAVGWRRHEWLDRASAGKFRPLSILLDGLVNFVIAALAPCQHNDVHKNMRDIPMTIRFAALLAVVSSSAYGGSS